MSQRARIEEVSDSDPEDMDPADFDPSNSIITPADIPQPTSSSSRSPVPPTPQEMLRPSAPSSSNSAQDAAQREATKHFQCLYPVYFDSSRSRAEGRRISKNLAVPNPLAREIVDAVAGLGLRCAFEPDKTHPKDWSNPGRVRVLLKQDGRAVRGAAVKSKAHLYLMVAKYLQEHPAGKDTPLRLRIHGLPIPEKIEPPAVPKGWKVNSIIPLHSPAMSGGGVSENFLKEMMAEMQGQPGMPQLPGAASAPEPKKKKEKKKAKA